MRDYIVFDCETVAIPDAAAYLEPCAAPANYKDQSKIDAYIADAQRRQVEQAALDIDLASVVAIGTQTIGGQCAFVGPHEVSHLITFWALVRALPNSPLIGFGILHYDLPLLMRRSQLLRIDYVPIGVDRYRHPRVIDLMEVLSFGDRQKVHSLSFYCKRFGIDVPDDGIKGEHVALAVQEGRWNDIETHVTSDVSRVLKLAQRLGVIQSVIEAPAEPAEIF